MPGATTPLSACSVALLRGCLVWLTFSWVFGWFGSIPDGSVFSENQLTNITIPGQWRSDFLYDGLGRRRIARDFVWQSGAWNLTNETRLIYDGLLIIQERDSNNVPLVSYTRGLDYSGSLAGAGGIGGLLARADTNGACYYHSDGSGNVTCLVDSSGSVVARYLYDPFGRVLGQWGTLADANTMQFSSMPHHAGSGLSLYTYRAYDPNLQRWPNLDPIGEAGGLNQYAMVSNDPVNQVDPLGLDGLIYFRFADGSHFKQIIPSSPEAATARRNDEIKQILKTFMDEGGTDAAMMLIPLPGPDEAALAAFLAKFCERYPCLCKTMTEKVAKWLEKDLSNATKTTPKWPKTAKEMDELLKMRGEKIPDGLTTPGRDKTVWRPNSDTKITLEQHPYDATAPDWHKGPHWHLDTPGKPHQRYVPGDDIPGY